ncbi:hypothetical protein SARC_06019 [Sphaeroforma arctica JP610]|uniref:Uncharacterized protein n=1 Tax=Sphaeroforma arctica JP610 TaxID=667725 RepID=A0A0L0FXV9_9EUKA|nr:hypothetical protein SARC_06019 [Sphaeroforma arctica JP610]KNC81665.1 hypothetical protein SARC_06019 [Sphaeroforma arctica JP610]|eukprot:XP_014155567.1 hypothetical protein SARC_06019 [Sphaeroforma arctica JP610]
MKYTTRIAFPNCYPDEAVIDLGCFKKLKDNVPWKVFELYDNYDIKKFEGGEDDEEVYSENCGAPHNNSQCPNVSQATACESGECVHRSTDHDVTMYLCETLETGTKAILTEYSSMYYTEYPERFEELIRRNYSVEYFKTL